MWSLWEENGGQFSVVLKIWKPGSWQMCKNKELPLGWQCILFAQKCKGIMEEMVDSIEKLCDEVETVNFIWEQNKC